MINQIKFLVLDLRHKFLILIFAYGLFLVFSSLVLGTKTNLLFLKVLVYD